VEASLESVIRGVGLQPVRLTHEIRRVGDFGVRLFGVDPTLVDPRPRPVRFLGASEEGIGQDFGYIPHLHLFIGVLCLYAVRQHGHAEGAC